MISLNQLDYSSDNQSQSPQQYCHYTYSCKGSESQRHDHHHHTHSQQCGPRCIPTSYRRSPQRQPHHPYSLSDRTLSSHPSDPLAVFDVSSMGSSTRSPERTADKAASGAAVASAATSVAQALEIARESPDGARDPIISGILEDALSVIWAKVKAEPDSYVMKNEEFAVFNFFQHRFTGNKLATAARARYWNHASA